jgi:hypothetical protein
MQYLNYVLFLILVALQAADAYTTWRVLRAGGRELNPALRLLMDRIGIVPALAVVKLVAVLFVGLFLLEHVVILLALVGLYAWVVQNNWRQMRKQGAA